MSKNVKWMEDSFKHFVKLNKIKGKLELDDIFNFLDLIEVEFVSNNPDDDGVIRIITRHKVDLFFNTKTSELKFETFKNKS